MLFYSHRGRLGSPRLTKELQEAGEIGSKNRVAKRMKQLNLHAKLKKKFKVTVNSKYHLPTASNLLKGKITFSSAE